MSLTSTNSSSNFSTRGVRLRNEFLTLEYVNNKPLFKSIRKATSYLHKMGIQRRDGHFLNIEETLYLSEIGGAIVVDQKGKQLTIPQLYKILGNLRVSLLKYTVFTQLIRAGYIVKTPKKNQENNNQSSFGYSVKMRTFQFPKELMDQFPHVYSTKLPSGPFSFRLHLPQINTQSGITHLFVSDIESEHIKILDLNTKMAEKIKKSEFQLISNIRRFDREPWECLRPRYWPNFNCLSSCENWKTYQIRREAIISNRRGNKRGRREEDEEGNNREPGYDYELFNKSATNRPIYRVLVIDDRFPSGHPNFAELQYLTESPNYSNNGEQKINNFNNYLLPPLLVASGSPNCLRFIQIQKGDPLNICLPQNDFTEFNNLL
ncbi:unnamed protein product [Meloidogyne enterolobii]|uniref:Uncharacterized protein n=1 Tax=Meloidogyne enterolobii TaxID=390850 RepID=A0ACB0Y475_MELEN